MADSNAIEDPCGEWGPTQRWALVWFVSVIVIGVFATSVLMRIDTWMYVNDAEVMDNEATRSIRKAATSIPMGETDDRVGGRYSNAARKVSSN